MTRTRLTRRVDPRLTAAWAPAVVIILLAGSPGAVHAAPAPVLGRTAVVQAISDCRKLADDAARLTCYDRAADAFEQAQAKGQVVVVDREEVRKVRRQSFGFNIPAISIFTHGPKEEAVDQVSVELASAHKGGDGRWVLSTTDNAVWRQIDDQPLFDDPHSKSTMAIRKAMLGSFFCNVDGQPAIRCVRER